MRPAPRPTDDAARTARKAMGAARVGSRACAGSGQWAAAAFFFPFYFIFLVLLFLFF